MITQIRGRIAELNENRAVIDVSGISYEVLISKIVSQSLKERTQDAEINLYTYHYLQSDPSKSFPVLIGFQNTVERDFFEKFITVSGIGPRAALKAFSVSISQIAQAIDNGDIPFLKTLQGVGEQRAREIVAKLQGKVGRFALIQDSEVFGKTASVSNSRQSLHEEALLVLDQLQYSKEEAKKMIQAAFTSNPKLSSVEELLNEVYRQRTVQPQAQ